MIIELLKMPRCMMHKGDKFLVLVVIGILVQPKIFLALKTFIKDKFPRLRKRHQLRLEKLLMKNILEIMRQMTMNY